jgi:hypothetical protein
MTNDSHDPLASEPVAGEGSPRAHRRPHPSRPYIVTATIKDAPGPFEQVEGVAQYDVSNDRSCGKYNSATGTRMRITSNEHFPMERISDTEYRGIFHLDLMQDEDYFGAGVCRWEFTEVRVGFKAKAGSVDTEFVPGIPGSEVLAQQQVIRYFWKDGYPDVPTIPNYADFGKANAEAFKPEIRGELFTIVLTPKEGKQ